MENNFLLCIDRKNRKQKMSKIVCHCTLCASLLCDYSNHDSPIHFVCNVHVAMPNSTDPCSEMNSGRCVVISISDASKEWWGALPLFCLDDCGTFTAFADHLSLTGEANYSWPNVTVFWKFPLHLSYQSIAWHNSPYLGNEGNIDKWMLWVCNIQSM